MSVTDPNYSKNPILDGFEHVGHWLHEGYDVAVDIIPEVATVYPEVKQELPAAEDEVKLALTKAVALEPVLQAITTAVSNKLVNILDDEAVVTAIEGNVANFVALYDAILALANTLKTDVETDISSISNTGTSPSTAS